MSRLRCRLSLVAYVLNSDTTGGATPVVSGWDRRASEGGTAESEPRVMARTKADSSSVRLRCPEHPDNRVWLDGFERCVWSDVHRRPRFRCVTPRGHEGPLVQPAGGGAPADRAPSGLGAACPACEHVYARHEGVRTGRDFVFGQAEIALLLLRIGEGMSPRAASQDLRASVFRSRGRRPSRQANLAVDYLDAVVAAVVAASHWSAADHARAVRGGTPARRGGRRRADRGGVRPAALSRPGRRFAILHVTC